MRRFRYIYGLTLAEIVVVVGIILVISTIVMNVFYGSRNSLDLGSGIETTRSALDEARTLSLYSIPESDFGVRIGSTTLEIFEGPTYESTSVIKEIELAEGIEVFALNLNGGGNDVVYNKVIGTTATPGNLILENTRNHATTSVEIYASGLTNTIK